jgi:hypothetical protein
MEDIYEKKRWILEQEEAFARRLSLQVIDRPRLSIWMILIPIIFVHYFYRFQRFVSGQKEFVQNYLIGIRRALEGAVEAVEKGKNPEPKTLAAASDVPEIVREKQAEVYAVLLDHYTDLLRARGDDVESLIRSAYKSQTNYLLFLNHLDRVEKDRNAALKPVLHRTTEEVDEIVNRIERSSGALRREAAEKIFSKRSGDL